MYILFLVTCFLFCVCIIPTASLTCSMFLVLLQFVDILLFHVSGLSAVCRYFYCFMFQVFWFFLDALNLVSCFMSFEFPAFLYCTLRMLFRQKRQNGVHCFVNFDQNNQVSLLIYLNVRVNICIYFAIKKQLPTYKLREKFYFYDLSSSTPCTFIADSSSGLTA